MATLNITLPEGSSVCNGKQITFRAPCDCTRVEKLSINGQTYDLLNMNNNMVSTGNVFANGVLVSVMIDTENYKAYIQSSSSAITYHATLLSDNWVFDDLSMAYYYQEVDVDGILESDNPIVDIDSEYSNDIMDIYEYNNNICKIFYLKTYDGKIKAWSTEWIDKNLPIQLKVVR